MCFRYLLLFLESDHKNELKDYQLFIFCNPKSGGNKGAVLTNLKVIITKE